MPRTTTCQLFKWLLQLSLLIEIAMSLSLKLDKLYSYQVRKEGSRHLIYPDLFRDKSFFLLKVFSFDHLRNGTSSSLSIDWLLTIYKDGKARKEWASWILLPGDSLLMGDTQRHANENKLYFTGYSHLKESSYRYTFYEYDIDSRITTVIEIVDLVDGKKRGSDIFTNNVEDTCVFGFEGKRKLFANPETIDIEFEFKKLFSNEDSIVDEFTIVGNDANKVSKAILHNRNSKLDNELSSFKNNADGTDLFISCRSICLKFDKSINCSQFDHNGQITLNKIVSFLEPLKIVSVKDLRLGRVLLITKTSHNTIYSTDIRSDVVVPKPRDISKDFTGCDLSDERYLTFDAREIDNRIVAEYVCRNGSTYTFKHFAINNYRDNVAIDRTANF